MSDRALRWWLRGAMTIPFVVALVVMAVRGWTPVLDLAMTEFRVRDVGGRHTPLVGLPGRIGRLPEQGSHPGPLSFYLLAPVYRLFGASAVGLLVGAAVINLAAAWLCVWVAQHLGGRRLQVALGALVCVALSWYGASILTQPWNPYLPLVPFLLVLLATWAILLGAHRLLPLQVVAASLCAQTHVPYLSLGVALVALAMGRVTWQWWRHRTEPSTGLGRSAGWALGAGAAVWLPVFVDEWRHHPGNITMLREHFLDPPADPVGLVEGAKVVLRHFDVLQIVLGLFDRPSFYLDALDQRAGGSAVVGAVVLALWLASVAVWRRTGERRLACLHAVIGVVTALGMLSTGRIFGKVWYYLTLWAWLFCLLAVFAVLWTAVLLAGDRVRGIPLERLAGGVVVIALVSFVVDAARSEPPEYRLGNTLEAVVGPTAAALRAGTGAATGADGAYVVVWNDSFYFGSQGFGFVNELERLGLSAFGQPYYAVAFTPRRSMEPRASTAEVVLATGVYIERWREVDGAVEVALTDPRSAGEVAEFERLRAEVIALLQDGGWNDEAEQVDTNLFGLSDRDDLPDAVAVRVARMLYLGQETAVFIAPAGSFDAQG